MSEDILKSSEYAACTAYNVWNNNAKDRLEWHLDNMAKRTHQYNIFFQK